MTIFSCLGFAHVVTVALSLSPSTNILRAPGTHAFLQNRHSCVPQTRRALASQLASHSTVVSPIQREGGNAPVEGSSSSLEDLCTRLHVTPPNLLRLQSSSDGVRGVYLNRSIKNGDVLLSIPLDSCLQDDDPPVWMTMDSPEGASDEGSAGYCNPSEWSTRLAASLLDLQLQTNQDSFSAKDGHSMWLSMLPDSMFLRASLPVHWTDDVVMSARCTALELAMDSAYFARAEAVEDLIVGLGGSDLVKDLSSEEVRTLCNNALDLVQTRSCRVEPKDGVQWGPPLRIMAPVFDFINHGSSKSFGDGAANAAFGLEGGEVTDLRDPRLVVRATTDLVADEEILIDYGESARPAWRCLASYGFVPEYKDDEDEDVAEVYLNGVRYEVGPSTVPCDLVERVSASIQEDKNVGSALSVVDQMLDGSFHNNVEQDAHFDDEKWEQEDEKDAETMLSPAVAVTIAKRLSDVAFQLLLDPEDPQMDIENDATVLRSKWLAASLRWSQHRILLACAMGLRDWVTRQR